jgi:hypothetical protein
MDGNSSSFRHVGKSSRRLRGLSGCRRRRWGNTTTGSARSRTTHPIPNVVDCSFISMRTRKASHSTSRRRRVLVAVGSSSPTGARSPSEIEYPVAAKAAGARLGARDRVALLLDEDQPVVEYGAGAVALSSEVDAPSDGVIVALGAVHGRSTVVICYDWPGLHAFPRAAGHGPRS